MRTFYIRDVDGVILYKVDTVKYPNAKPHNCKIIDPANNIITHVGNRYFIAKRNRKGVILEPIVWLPITHEYYDMFLFNGAGVVPAPQSLINFIDMEVESNG